MTKRIFILSIALTFLVSTTGLPITLHLCEIMQQESISECEMCAPVVEEPTCCGAEKPEGKRLTSATPVCCQTEFNFNKIEDSFLSTEKSRILNFDISAFPLFAPTEILTEVYTSNPLFYSDLSPPQITPPDLFILNSALLI